MCLTKKIPVKGGKKNSTRRTNTVIQDDSIISLIHASLPTEDERIKRNCMKNWFEFHFYWAAAGVGGHKRHTRAMALRRTWPIMAGAFGLLAIDSVANLSSWNMFLVCGLRRDVKRSVKKW